MGRPVVLSNGHILVGLDEHGTVQDFYYPYIGEENIVGSRNLNHKIGVWVDGKFSWIDDGSWQISLDFEENALVSTISARSEELAVNLDFKGFVDGHYPAFCRQIVINNLSDQKREIRLFMHQAFQISRAGRSDTALFVPVGNYILDYKGWASLLIYAEDAQTRQPFDQFAVGNCGIEGKEGTFRDAEDGELSGGLVEHGGVDSVVRLKFEIDGNSSAQANYWVIAADSRLDAESIHFAILEKTVDSRLESTRQSFADWLSTALPRLENLNEKYLTAAKKSLLIVKSHIDKHGGVIASCDSSIYNYGRDYYSYVWPRDAAYALVPLIELGYRDEPRRFFEFCADTMNPGGYMMHKYQPDRAIGSTWHPLLHVNHPELPIQEDETAIVVCAMKIYLDISNDEDFIRNLYSKFILPCANFMNGFIDEQTNLPHASYDLWEQKFATFTYTVFLTIAGLRAAAGIAERLHKFEDRDRWNAAAERISGAIGLLINADNGAFFKSLLLKADGSMEFDNTVDASSFYGAFLSMGDSEQLAASVRLVEEKLLGSAPIGGVPRYEHDDYFLKDPNSIGNPWIITTLWLAQYYLKSDRREEALKLVDWTLDRAGQSGILAEQADPNTGFGVGVSPLVWSHSTLLETLLMLADQGS